MSTLVSRQEPHHRCEFLWMLGEKGRGLDRFGAHREFTTLFERSETNFGTFEYYLK